MWIISNLFNTFLPCLQLQEFTEKKRVLSQLLAGECPGRHDDGETIIVMTGTMTEKRSSSWPARWRRNNHRHGRHNDGETIIVMAGTMTEKRSSSWPARWRRNDHRHGRHARWLSNDHRYDDGETIIITSGTMAEKRITHNNNRQLGNTDEIKELEHNINVTGLPKLYIHLLFFGILCYVHNNLYIFNIFWKYNYIYCKINKRIFM